MVRKLAVLEGAGEIGDPVAWYVSRFNKQPDYAELLDHLTKTSGVRQGFLRQYFEPTQQELEEGKKRPTGAHRALAKLVRAGYVKVIVTTNFDRLIERALEDEGILPTVLATADQIKGANALTHQRCCVIKVHGDYQDTRIKNTPEELKQYDNAMDSLLDRVFEDYGLVVCGWSADWDVALRAAIERAVDPRFPLYWAARGAPSEKAKALIEHRSGVIISIDGADEFFEDLHEKVSSMEPRIVPNSPAILHDEVSSIGLRTAVNPPASVGVEDSIKQILSSGNMLQLESAIQDTIKLVMEEVKRDDGSALNEKVTAELVLSRIRAYSASCSSLASVGYLCGRWGDKNTFRLLVQGRDRLFSLKECGEKSNRVWLDFRAYPACVWVYSILLGAMLGGNLEVMLDILKGTILRDGERAPAIWNIIPTLFITDHDSVRRALGNRWIPVNEAVHDFLLNEIGDNFPTKRHFTEAFGRIELLMSLHANYQLSKVDGTPWYTYGRFAYDEFQERISEILEDLAEHGQESVYVKTSLFGKEVAECKLAVEKIGPFLRQHYRF